MNRGRRLWIKKLSHLVYFYFFLSLRLFPPSYNLYSASNYNLAAKFIYNAVTAVQVITANWKWLSQVQVIIKKFYLLSEERNKRADIYLEASVFRSEQLLGMPFLQVNAFALLDDYPLLPDAELERLQDQ